MSSCRASISSKRARAVGSSGAGAAVASTTSHARITTRASPSTPPTVSSPLRESRRTSSTSSLEGAGPLPSATPERRARSASTFATLRSRISRVNGLAT